MSTVTKKTVTKRAVRLSDDDKERVIAFNCAMQYFKKCGNRKLNDKYYDTMLEILFETAPVIIINKLKGSGWVFNWALECDYYWCNDTNKFIEESEYLEAYRKKHEAEAEAKQAKREAEQAAEELLRNREAEWATRDAERAAEYDECLNKIKDPSYDIELNNLADHCERHGVDFNLIKSKAYLKHLTTRLSDKDEEILSDFYKAMNYYIEYWNNNWDNNADIYSSDETRKYSEYIVTGAPLVYLNKLYGVEWIHDNWGNPIKGFDYETNEFDTEFW